jgi:hypothetical protein
MPFRPPPQVPESCPYAGSKVSNGVERRTTVFIKRPAKVDAPPRIETDDGRMRKPRPAFVDVAVAYLPCLSAKRPLEHRIPAGDELGMRCVDPMVRIEARLVLPTEAVEPCRSGDLQS